MLKKGILALLVSLLLCGCTSNKNYEEISFSSWGSISETTIIKNVITDFESKNPGIKVKFIHIPQNYFQKLHLLFASNTAPDVIFINNLNLPVYKNQLEDLSQKFDTEKFFPQAIAGMSIDNKIYGVPRDISNLVFYVNLDLIELPLPQMQEITKIKTPKGVFLTGYEEDIYYALPYLWAFGGGILDENLNLIIDSKESKEGIEFYKNLSNKYKIAPTKSEIGSSTVAQMFLDKKIALYLSGRWMYPKISEKADFNWTIAPFFSTVPTDVSGWAISKNSKHKESAMKFIEYLSSQETIEHFTQTGLIVPARIDAANLLKNDKEGVFLEVIKTSKKTPVNKDYKKLTDKINAHLM